MKKTYITPSIEAIEVCCTALTGSTQDLGYDPGETVTGGARSNGFWGPIVGDDEL